MRSKVHQNKRVYNIMYTNVKRAKGIEERGREREREKWQGKGRERDRMFSPIQVRRMV